MDNYIKLNPTETEFRNLTTGLIKEGIEKYSKMLADNKLNPVEYEPQLSWNYEQDDFVKNRITLTIYAVPKI